MLEQSTGRVQNEMEYETEMVSVAICR